MIIEDPRSAIVSDIGNPIRPVNKRNFIKLGDNRYFNIPPIVLPEDFTLTLKTTLPENGGYFLSDRFSSDKYQRLGITADGRLFGMLAVGSFGLETSRPDGVISKIVISRSSATLSAYLNGVEVYSLQSDRVFIINSIGSPYSGSTSISHLDGAVQSFHVAGDNITSAGESVDELFYPLDDSPDNFPVIRNGFASLGPELWNYPLILDGSVSQYQSLGGVFNFGVEEKATYLVKLSVQGVSQGQFRLRVGDTATPQLNKDGDYVFALSSLSRTRLLAQETSSNGFIADSVEISVRKATGYGTFVNGSTDAYGEFTEQVNDDWLGSDLPVPPWDSTNQLIEVMK